MKNASAPAAAVAVAGTALVRIAFGAAIALAAVMAMLPKPPHLPTDQLGDKFHHILAFVVLTALALAAFPRASRWRLAERLSFFGALIEVGQAIPALHRDCDIRDWVADTLAIAVVMLVWNGWEAFRRRG